MRLHRGKGSVRALLFCLVFVLIASPPITAYEAWSVDMAQMLMAEDWDLGQEQETAVVGYLIHLVEIERGVAQALSFQMDLASAETPGLWLVAGEGLDLTVKGGSPLTWSAQSQVYVGRNQQALSYDSWLLTVDGQPLRVDVSKTKVPADPHAPKQEQLEITIFPKKVLGERIESEIHIAYQTFQGTVAQVATTHWVGPEADQPVAVVSRQVNRGKTQEYQYFAVYVAGMLISHELIPEHAQFLSMGSIAGLERFMETAVPEQRWVELGVSLSRGQEEWGWQLDGSFPLGDKHRIYGQVKSLPQPAYLMGAEGSLNPELHFVVEAAGGRGEGPFLRFGIRDEVRLSENLRLSAALLPLTFSFESWKPDLTLDWRIRAEFVEEKYELWYQLDHERDEFRHSAGATIFPTQKVGAKVSWTWDGESGSVFLVGLEVRF